MIPFKQDLIASKSIPQKITEDLGEFLRVCKLTIQNGNSISRDYYCPNVKDAEEVVQIMKNHGYNCTFSYPNTSEHGDYVLAERPTFTVS